MKEKDRKIQEEEICKYTLEEQIKIYKEELNKKESKEQKTKNILKNVNFILNKIILILIIIGLSLFVINTIENIANNRDIKPRIEKPVIYLYPKQKENVNVKLDTHLSLTSTYPIINKNNEWNVIADKDGIITQNNNSYSYLYYEGEGNINYDLSKGFVIKGSESAEFLEKILIKKGLTYKEREDFITYWLPRLQKNNYNLIHFSENEYENKCKLNINPKPDTIIRLYMVYKPLEKPIKISPQTIKSINRNGFTVVEWGGTELK